MLLAGLNEDFPALHISLLSMPGNTGDLFGRQRRKDLILARRDREGNRGAHGVILYGVSIRFHESCVGIANAELRVGVLLIGRNIN